MSLKTILQHIGAWFKRTFNNVKDNVIPTAIAITQGIKHSLDNGVLPEIANIIGEITGSQIPAEAITVMKANIDKVLLSELALQGLPDNATPEQLTAFEQEVFKAFTGKNSYGRSKLFTTLAVQIKTDVDQLLNIPGGAKFADVVNAIEEAWVQYQDDLANPDLQPDNSG